MATHPEAGLSEAVDDPGDLSRDEYVAAAKRAVAEIRDDDVPGLAAGVAFRMFLALFPSLFAAVAVFSIVTTPAELSDLLSEVSAVVPERAMALVQEPLDELAGGGGAAGLAAVAGVLTGLYAATSAAVSLMKALSRSYDIPETRKFVRQRVTALALTLALLVALVAVIILLVAGRQVQEALLPGVTPPLSWLLGLVRFVLALVVLVALFAFVYWIGPDRDHPSWVWLSPGALVGLVGWLAVAGAFTVYAQNFGNYNATYGAIAGVAILLIWLQLSMLAVLAGAEFNAEVERARHLRRVVTDASGFAVPPPPAEHDTAELDVAGAGGPAPAVAGTTPAATGGASPAARRAGAVGAVAAGLTALAVFLGFARRRARR